jgi:hypothetical protein
MGRIPLLRPSAGDCGQQRDGALNEDPQRPIQHGPPPAHAAAHQTAWCGGESGGNRCQATMPGWSVGRGLADRRGRIYDSHRGCQADKHALPNQFVGGWRVTAPVVSCQSHGRFQQGSTSNGMGSQGVLAKAVQA